MVNDPSIINQMINSVMKVYTTNGTLIKTSSSAEGLLRIKQVYNATTISDDALAGLIAVVQFTRKNYTPIKSFEGRPNSKSTEVL